MSKPQTMAEKMEEIRTLFGPTSQVVLRESAKANMEHGDTSDDILPLYKAIIQTLDNQPTDRIIIVLGLVWRDVMRDILEGAPKPEEG